MPIGQMKILILNDSHSHRIVLFSHLAYSKYDWMRQVMYKLSSYDLITIHTTYHYQHTQRYS